MTNSRSGSRLFRQSLASVSALPESVAALVRMVPLDCLSDQHQGVDDPLVGRGDRVLRQSRAGGVLVAGRVFGPHRFQRRERRVSHVIAQSHSENLPCGVRARTGERDYPPRVPLVSSPVEVGSIHAGVALTRRVDV